MNIIEKSLRYRQVTLSVLVFFFLLGAYSLLKMPRREDPKISIPQGLVVAHYPGAGSAQVEEQVTKPIEECLFKFEEVKKAHTTSSSEEGKTVITVELRENVKDKDVFWNKLRHALLILKQQQLPQGVIGPVVNAEFGDTEALIFALSGDGVSYDQLRQYAQRLEDQLRSIPAVSKVKRDGERQEQILLSFSGVRLAQYGLSLTDVMQVLKSQNEVYPTGSVEGEATDVVLHTRGYYTSTQDLGLQVVGVSPTGSDVRLRDVATITRGYSDPTSKVKVAASDAIIVSVECSPGNNIVDFGKAVQQKVETFEREVPSSVHITTISNQPEIVDTNISHFIREFFIAIGAVIIIILLMLPLRIALVAAMAIPMTIALTLGIMNIAGIELQQVSLAALIVVLGLVVDDAIVVADNYVELLDKGETRWNAAWKSASELVVPILVATLTIIFAFLPMLILTGAVGEFIETLPLTVSVALGSSFLVAMLFTPILCHTFVRKGLHSATPQEGSEQQSEAEEETAAGTPQAKKRRSVLDLIQDGYNRLLSWCVVHRWQTVTLGILPLIAALLIYKYGIRQKFFPSAERNQFVVELWMPTGTPLATTEQCVARLDHLLDGDSRVTSHTTFVGTSAPRFYYNFSPEFPTPNFAQIVVNTTSNESTLALAAELTPRVEATVPEGRCKVRLMQQGKPLKAEIEVRIWGDDLQQLKALGIQADSILRAIPGTTHVQDNFREDYYTLDIHPKPEAQRLGFTTQSIALSLYADFKGAPVTTIREGDRGVSVMARLDEAERSSIDDISHTYLTSPITRAKVPVSQIADIQPAWKTGRIIHRNGLRVLTIEAETDGTALPAEVLAKAREQIERLPLPAGYEITYGGEDENKTETFSEMLVALCISLLLIFFVLLFQFRNLKETLLILLTIPLSVFGAMVGLLVTGNNFGFTAFVGVICLSGIVVRNSIILIDHIHELADKHHMTYREATIESGRRRLRPIFLTAMAAAFGVVPMILSASPMWSPLASIIAFGVVWSMVVALLVVPVLYLMWVVKDGKQISTDMEKPLLILLLPLLACPTARAQDTLTIAGIVDQALVNNNMLRIARLKAEEEQSRVEQTAIKRLPVVTLNSLYMYRFKLGELTLPAGSFGALPTGTGTLLLPTQDLSMTFGKHHTLLAGVMAYQPLTQQPKIGSAIRMAEADKAIAQLQLTAAELQVVSNTEQLLYALLAVRKQEEEAEKRIAVARLKRRDAESAQMAGKALAADLSGLTAEILAREQDLMGYRTKEGELLADLQRVAGINLTGRQLSDGNSIDTDQHDLAYYTTLALQDNIDVKISEAQIAKSQQGIKAAKQSYLPDVGAMAGYSYQNSIDLLSKSNPYVGVSFKWNLNDAWANRHTVRQAELKRQQAIENNEQTRRNTLAAVEKAYRQMKQAEHLMAVAAQAADYAQQTLRIEQDRMVAGLTTELSLLTREAENAKAESDLYASQQSYRMAQAALQVLVARK